MFHHFVCVCVSISFLLGPKHISHHHGSHGSHGSAHSVPTEIILGALNSGHGHGHQSYASHYGGGGYSQGKHAGLDAATIVSAIGGITI